MHNDLNRRTLLMIHHALDLMNNFYCARIWYRVSLHRQITPEPESEPESEIEKWQQPIESSSIKWVNWAMSTQHTHASPVNGLDDTWSRVLFLMGLWFDVNCASWEWTWIWTAFGHGALLWCRLWRAPDTIDLDDLRKMTPGSWPVL